MHIFDNVPDSREVDPVLLPFLSELVPKSCSESADEPYGNTGSLRVAKYVLQPTVFERWYSWQTKGRGNHGRDYGKTNIPPSQP